MVDGSPSWADHGGGSDKAGQIISYVLPAGTHLYKTKAVRVQQTCDGKFWRTICQSVIHMCVDSPLGQRAGKKGVENEYYTNNCTKPESRIGRC